MITTIIQEAIFGKTKYIEFTLNGDTLERTWGLMGGAEQATSNTYDYINKGKSNQKTPEQAASADLHRIVAKKCKEGYRVINTGYNLDQFPEGWISDNQGHNDDSSLGDFDCLPTAFCMSKPRNSMTKSQEKKINIFLVDGTACCDIKVNGICHYILATSTGDVRVYTRRMDDHTKKYPQLVAAVRASNIPPYSLLIAELTVANHRYIPHMAAFKAISEISKVDTVGGKLKDDLTKSLKRQEKSPVQAVIFGALYWNRRPLVESMTMKENKEHILTWLNSIANPVVTENQIPILSCPETIHSINSIRAGKSYLQSRGDDLEGLVIWMLDEKMEVSFNGKPKRRAAFKLKIKKDIDVIATGYVEGKGDRQGKIGALKIAEFVDGKLVDLGTVGSGIRDDQADPKDWTFPCVIEIQYDNRYSTGKFQFSRFTKVHEDKTVGAKLSMAG